MHRALGFLGFRELQGFQVLGVSGLRLWAEGSALAFMSAGLMPHTHKH